MLMKILLLFSFSYVFVFASESIANLREYPFKGTETIPISKTVFKLLT